MDCALNELDWVEDPDIPGYATATVDITVEQVSMYTEAIQVEDGAEELRATNPSLQRWVGAVWRWQEATPCLTELSQMEGLWLITLVPRPGG